MVIEAEPVDGVNARDICVSHNTVAFRLVGGSGRVVSDMALDAADVLFALVAVIVNE